MNHYSVRLTVKAAKQLVREAGYVLRHDDSGDWIVWTGREGTAYYTSDLEDAVGTARAMSQAGAR